jgi:tetratricopeptide (TPR) repeat protein
VIIRSIKFFIASFILVHLVSCVSTNDSEANIKDSRTSSESSFALANKYARDGLLSEAIEHYKRALKGGKHKDAIFRNMGIIQVKIGDYRSAVNSFTQAEKKFDDDFEFNFYKAEAHRALKQYDKAIYHYTRADNLRPNQGRVQKALAWTYFQIRYYAKALTIGKQLLKNHKDDNQVYLIVARTLLKTNRDESALKVLNAAKKHANQTEMSYIKSIEGDIYLNRKSYDEAARAYRYALKKQPLLAGALYGLGQCLVQDKQIDRGIKYLERAMRVRPDHAETYLSLGNAYKLKNDSKYKSYMKQFIKLSANDPELLGEAEKIKESLK